MAESLRAAGNLTGQTDNAIAQYLEYVATAQGVSR
jgi:hypothetical protein